MAAAAGPPASRPRRRRSASRVLVVIGAGASGTLAAAHLLRAPHGDWRIVLIDREGNGMGAAYSTRDPRHLLNVAAARMSAFDDDPLDFVRWCRGQGRATGAHDYLPRQLYGSYLRALLERFAVPGELELVRDQALAITRAGGRRPLRVGLRDGPSIGADAAVVATGNPRPAPLVAGGAGGRVLEDPWNPRSLERMRDAARVVVVGSGLTAVDLTLSITTVSPAAEVLALSRHGELPRAQTGEEAPSVASPLPANADPLVLSDLVDAVVEAVAAQPSNWRAVIDSLRPHTPQLWQALSVDERRTFLREVKWLWDVHRHRMAPEVAERIDDLRAQGRLKVRRGAIASLTSTATSVVVEFDDADGRHRLCADWVVNATGPAASIADDPDPLVQQLLSSGLALADELGICFACRGDGALLDRYGKSDGRLFALGPPRRGELLESSAIPEIRTQAASIGCALVSRREHGRPELPALAVG